MCQNFRVSKTVTFQWVTSRFSVEKFLSHSVETFRRGKLLCCVTRNLLVARRFMDKREGEYQDFPLKFFLSHSADKTRKGTIQGVTDSGYRNIFCFRGLCHVFLSKNFCLIVPKNFIGEPFRVSVISGIEKVYA